VRRRIEDLERQLGVALFTRSPGGLTPTDLARELSGPVAAMAAAAADRAEGMQRQLDALQEQMNSLRHDASGGTPETDGAAYLATFKPAHLFARAPSLPVAIDLVPEAVRLHGAI